jgi:hypothetical protein
MLHLFLFLGGIWLLLDGYPIFGAISLIIAVVGAIVSILDRFT